MTTIASPQFAHLCQLCAATTLQADILLGGPTGRTISRTYFAWSEERQDWVALRGERFPLEVAA